MSSTKQICSLMTLILFMGSSSVLGTVSIQRNLDEIIYSFDIKEFKSTKINISGKKYHKLSLAGVDGYEGIRYEVGKPELPVIRLLVTGKPTITFGKQSQSVLGASATKIAPAQPSRVKLKNAVHAFSIDAQAYQSSSLEPQAPYSIVESGSIRGVKQYLVTLYPVAYAPKNGRYLFRREFSVRFKDKSEKNHEPLNEVMAFVVPKQFIDSPSVKKYQRFKESVGFLIETIDIQNLDTPDSIRTKIKRLYQRADLKHLLIIGDAELVPAKESNIISGVTDHYYRAIDTNDYETDINGPDIGVGRISVKNEYELNQVVDKYIKYESGIFESQEWLNGIAFIATDDQHEIAESSHDYAIENYTIAHGYKGVFPNSEEPGGDKLYAISHEVSDQRVNEVLALGRTIINYSGHGGTTFWDAPHVNQEDVRTLEHTDATAFVVSNACITGQFTEDESFGETWQRHPNGAIGYWGSMDNTFWDEDDILERRMYDGIFQENLSTFADITNYALKNHWLYYGGQGKSSYYWETYVLLGDPSQSLRTTKVREPVLNSEDSLPVGITQASFIVKDDSGFPIEGAKVSLTEVEGPLKFGTTSQQTGRAIIDFNDSLHRPTELMVVISGPNLKLSRSWLKIAQAEEAYLSLSDFTFNHRENNGAYINENVALNFLATNWGRQSSEEASISIVDITGPASIINDEARIPSIAPKQSFEYEGQGLVISIWHDADANQPIGLTLSIDMADGHRYHSYIDLLVMKAGLQVINTDFGIPLDVGGIDPGQAGNIFFDLKNNGSESISHGLLELHPKSCVSSIDNDLSIELLDPQDSIRMGPISTVISEECSRGDTARIQAILNYQSLVTKISLEEEIDFLVGKIDEYFSEHKDILKDIPDTNEPVIFPIDWQRPGIITDAGIHIDLDHTYIGDLSIKLIHPDGTEILLRKDEGDGDDDLNITYGRGGIEHKAMDKLSGKPCEGVWQLVITDEVSSDSGMLNAVTLNLAGYFKI